MDQPDIAAMTGAELRATREFLGLSTLWLARWLDVGERKLIRWESSELPIPGGVIGQIDDLYEEAATEVARLVAELRPVVQRDGQSWLTTYRTDQEYWARTGQGELGNDRYPARWHRAICARVAEQVPGVVLTYGQAAA